MTLTCRIFPGTPTLVLLHGIQGTAAAWNGVIGHLPREFGLVAPNMRGRAGSYSPEDPNSYRINDFSNDLAGLLDMLEAPVWLCGWSMGVLVTLDYLARFGQDRVAGLMLASGTACLNGEAKWFQGETVEEIALEAADRAETLGLTEAATPTAAAGAWLSARETDLRDSLAGIKIPALVIHGSADDQCPPAHGQTIAETIPGARFDLWEGGGHNLMKEDPKRFAETVAAFVRT